MPLGDIPAEEISFFSSASPIHSARLFSWNGNLYRAIHASAIAQFEQFFSAGIADELMEKRLIVETDIEPRSLEGYNMVLRHRRIPFVTYCFEWPAEALRDAAIALIDLNIALAKHGLATQDAHPWNILFDGPRPVFVDYGCLNLN